MFKAIEIQYFLKINNQMQNNFSNQKSPIFMPIHSDIINDIKKDVLNLHSTFWINQNKQQQIHVVMSTNFIALCQKNGNSLQYLYYTPIDFDLKFEIVYEGENIPNKPQGSIFSKHIGFRLLKQDALAVEFQTTSLSLLPVWLKYLSKMLNQVGFHKLFNPKRKLGKGGFATVYEVERLTDGKMFAVKAFSKQNTLFSRNQSHRLSLLNEIKMMRSVQHANLIKLQAVFESQNSLYVVLELLNAGHLHKQINTRKGNFSIDEIKTIMFGLIKGLKHLQEANILHRDIKPENIMLRNNLEPVLVDFGLSTKADAQDYIFYRCGTPGYVSPQVTMLEKGAKIKPVCDIFSLGVIFHILLMARPLFEGKKFQEVYQNNKKMKFNLNSSMYNMVDPQAMDLLKKMLEIDPYSRIPASRLINHPFFISNESMVDQKYDPTNSTLRNNKIQEIRLF